MDITPAAQLAKALERHAAIAQAAAEESQRIAGERAQAAATATTVQGLKPPQSAA